MRLRGYAWVFALIGLLACDGPAWSAMSGDDYAASGIAHFQAGNYRLAADALEQAAVAGVKGHPLADIYSILGNAYSQMNEFGKAIAAYKKALQADPSSHAAWVNLGIAYRLISDFDSAEACYKQAQALNPDYPALYASLGALYVVKGEPDKAVESLRRAIKLDPQLAVAHSNLALALAMTGKFDEARSALKQAVVLGYPNSETIRKRIADLEAVKK